MPLAASNLNYLRTVISQSSGNVVSETQSYLLESRLKPVAESVGLTDVDSLVVELQRTSSSTLHERVAAAMTINETSFFRDMQPFEALQTDVLPRLLDLKAASRELRIWSAACSSGQEPYSLAILLKEHFPQLESWQVEIVATDFSDEMVRRTQAGTYSQFEVNRGLPARSLVKYFERQGTHWQAQKALKDLIHCHKINLKAPFFGLPKFDVIFVRNVLIYFDPPSKESILTRMRQTLHSQGALFLGGGESLINLNVPFSRESVGPAVYYRPL